jgi:hypothetical protein
MKRLATFTLLAAFVGSLFGVAGAACPVPGVYTTLDGSLIGGRVSEAWCAGMPGQPGNTENAMSWDGALLGDMWHIWGMAIDANGAVEIGNTVDGNGNGTITYETHYDGGQFWLSGAYPWSLGGDLTGTVHDYVVIATVTLVGGQAVGLTSNVSFTGIFTNCANDCVIEFAIANALKVGEGDMLPADYPDFLCGATMGEWFDACCATASLDCAVDTDSDTWGSIKGLYR